MRDPSNIREIARLEPDYLGFIFHPGSKRYAGELSADALQTLPDAIRKVAVFVNLAFGEVLSKCLELGIRTVQLHGNESADYCRMMRESGLEVIKAFSIHDDSGFEGLKAYLDCSDYFLFDTAGKGYGGTGKQFDWSLLDEYNLDKPFFLSGGIGPSDAGRILKLDHPRFYGVDLNSRFETQPGLKNRTELEGFLRRIRAE